MQLSIAISTPFLDKPWFAGQAVCRLVNTPPFWPVVPPFIFISHRGLFCMNYNLDDYKMHMHQLLFHERTVAYICRYQIWRFPKIGVPLNHPFLFRVSHYKPSILGYQHLTSIYNIPVVLHKAVAEVSKIGHYRRGELLYGRANATDGPKSGWSCVFWSGCSGCSGHLTHNCWMWCGVVQL